jgi:hypothetical protein
LRGPEASKKKHQNARALFFPLFRSLIGLTKPQNHPKTLENPRKTLFEKKQKGGYDLRGLSDSVADSVRGLLFLPSLDTFDKGMLADEPGDKVAAAVAEARRIHGL